MGDLVNLRQARKHRQRQQKQVEAEANRRAFGRTGAEKARERKEKQLAARKLEAHKRETGE